MPAKLYTIRDRAICERDLENRFNEFVDDAFEPVKVLGYTYDQSHVLKEVDPVAYNQEYLAWLNLMVEERHFVEKDGQYFPAEDGYDD